MPEVQSRSHAHAPPAVIVATGRRKTSVARVRMKLGTGQILVNGRTLEEYFPRLAHRKMVMAPLEVASAAPYAVVIRRIKVL